MKRKNIRTGCRWAVLLVVAAMVLASCMGRNSAEDHYREGCQLEQQGRKADAIRQYQLAFGNGSDNSEFVRKSINAMGQLYLAAGRRDDALTQFRRSYDYAASSHDTVLMVLSLRDMSRCLRTPEWLPSAANCFERADQLITSAHLDSLRQQLLPEWIDVLTQLGDTAALAKIQSK